MLICVYSVWFQSTNNFPFYNMLILYKKGAYFLHIALYIPNYGKILSLWHIMNCCS